MKNKTVIRVGIDAEGFKKWGGGIDFVSMLASALESTGKIETYLLVGEEAAWSLFIKRIYWFVLSIVKKEKREYIENRENIEIIKNFRTVSPQTIILKYKRTIIRGKSNAEIKIRQLIKKNQIELLFPRLKCYAGEQIVPQIGHIYDCQHKHFPELFSPKVCEARDIEFEWQLKNSDYLVVYSEYTKKDIQMYYPQYSTTILVLPYKPFQRIRLTDMNISDKYSLPERYYVICNQFWKHKDHLTAFFALEKMFNNGIKDIHIVCTGKMLDSRNDGYIKEMNNEIEKMNCRNNIHFLGFIPKDDQLWIMLRSCGLIQPTLFEGTPGGMASLTAVSLGIPIYLSDIPVNLEVKGDSNVHFFVHHDSDSLFQVLSEYISDKRIEQKKLDEILEKNRKEYTEFLVDLVERAVGTHNHIKDYENTEG